MMDEERRCHDGPQRLLLQTLYERHYFPARLAGRRRASDEAYRGAVRRFERALGRRVYADELSDELLLEARGVRLAQMIVHRGQYRTVSPATVNRDERHLRAIGNFARRKGIIGWRPDIDPLPAPKRVANSWDFSSDIPSLFAAVERMPGTIEIDVHGCRQSFAARHVLGGLCALLLYTGARISVAMNLAPHKISIARRTVFLPAELQKQNAEQELPLHHTALDYVAPLLATVDRPYLIPWPYDRANSRPDRIRKTPALSWPALNRRFRALIRSAGIDDGGPRLFHRFRVTCATQMYIETGGNIDAVRRQLGHSSVNVTWSYIDHTRTSQPTAALLLPAVPRPTPQLQLWANAQ